MTNPIANRLRVSVVHIVSVACLLSALALVSSTSLPSASAAPKFPPCAASNLLITNGFGGAGAGNLITRLYLINDSSLRCRLTGYPQLSGSRNGSLFTPLHISEHGTYAGNLAPTVLSYRMAGELILGTADACLALNSGGQAKIARVARAHTYTSLMIKIPGSTGVAIVFGLQIDTTCGLDVSQLGWTN